ncbi:thymidylate kinase [Alishewanella aestuarii B11]|uniref:Thymidylate kinase n=1 Tax=Alishewanella aestuarii B11 TaxID=1197174 RepID=J2IFZ8_9ALTE|nr:dTMP kinase [Alishewanella aestuarii]EJI85689.1 thymidylate kinase [Alishewanella aestuarii B11]
MSSNGKFIVIEGLEGAGKSTAIATVKQYLESRGHQVVCTREPGGTPLAEQLRTLVKQADVQEQIAPETELLLMYASRVQLLTNVIRPALSAGNWVLADRHDLSSRAYQGGGRQLGDQLIDTLRQAVLGNTRPDLTLYLDLDPALGLARAASRGELDRIEQEQLSFFQRTRAKYLEIAGKEPNIVVIDASQPLAEVQQALVTALAAAGV